MKDLKEYNHPTSNSDNTIIEQPLENNTPFTEAELDRVPLLDNDHTYPIDSAKKWAEDIAKAFDKQDMEKGIFTTPRKIKEALVVNTQQKTIAFRNNLSTSSNEALLSDTTPEVYVFRTYTHHQVVSNTYWHHNWGWGDATNAPSNWAIAGTNQRRSDESNYGSSVKIIAYITWNG